jgi:hypothetical protein
MANTMRVPVPELIWNCLEESLGAAMRTLAKDIAKTLGQPEAPLLNAIKIKKMIPYIVEETTDREVDMRCTYVCEKAGTRLCQPCGQPILWSKGVHRCPDHLHLEQVRYTLPTVEPIEDTPYYSSNDGVVYSADYAPVGRYENGNLILFEVKN